MAGVAGEGEVGEVGDAVFAVVEHMMHRAHAGRGVAAGSGAAVQGCDQGEALFAGGEPFGAAQM